LEKIIHGLTTITLFEDNNKYNLVQGEPEDIAAQKKHLTLVNFKIPFLCSEIINCRVHQITDTIAKDGNLLELLLGYLEKRKKFTGKVINSCHDAYWLKAVHYFLKKYYFEVAYVLLAVDNFVENVIAIAIVNR
jgi:hypothetical protein